MYKLDYIDGNSKGIDNIVWHMHPLYERLTMQFGFPIVRSIDQMIKFTISH